MKELDSHKIHQGLLEERQVCSFLSQGLVFTETDMTNSNDVEHVSCSREVQASLGCLLCASSLFFNRLASKDPCFQCSPAGFA